MAQTINTNVASLNAQRNLSMSQSSLMTSMQRLSSGLRVNSAKDDAAGLAIARNQSFAIAPPGARWCPPNTFPSDFARTEPISGSAEMRIWCTTR